MAIPVGPRDGEQVTREPSISVVVPTYRRAHMIERVLEPVLEDPVPDEVIVVVDGARDGTLERVEAMSAADPRLRAVYIDNRGDMGARAAGAVEARGDVVLFLDDDVVAGPALAARHARRHAAGDADLVLGYMPMRPPSRRGGDDFAVALYAREYEGRCAIYEREPASVLRELWGGNFSIRRERCLAVGMANPRFTEPYHADRDFGVRCLEAGLTGAFDRTLAATHLHERSLESFVRDARSQGAARVLMSELHPATIAPLREDEFERALPVGLAGLVRLGRRRRARRAISATLRIVIRASGVLRMWPVQESGARLLRRLEQQRGAIDQRRGRRRG